MATDELSLAMANLTTQSSTPETTTKPKAILKKWCLENNLDPQFTYTSIYHMNKYYKFFTVDWLNSV